jgi:sodium/bile acid cotransporter 7
LKRGVDWFLLGMVVAVALAWLFPEPGARGGALHPELVNKIGVALIFFLHGLALSFQALKQGTLNYRLHLLVQLSTFLLFPLLGILVFFGTRSFLEPDLRVGLFFLCALPSTVSSSVALTAAAHGNVPGAVFNATVSSLIGVFLTPLWLGLLLGSVGQGLELGPVILDLVQWLVLPLAVGQLLRPVFGAFAARHKPVINKIDRVTILLLVYTSFCDSVKGGVWTGHGVLALVVTFVLSGALLAFVMSVVASASRSMRLSDADRIAAIFCGSKKTLASGVPMARLIFGAHPGLGLILLPIMIYHPLQLVVGGWLAGRWAARLGGETKAV